MQTHAAGSMLLVGVGRGRITAHGAPSDNKGNVFAQVGTTHAYRNWPKSGTALYVGAPVSGGAGHVVTAAKPAPTDETTVSVVEVLNARRIQDLQWNEVPAGRPLTSQRVRATGPALLVAWWWGDADARVPQTAVPDNGFVPIHAVLLAGNYVQCAVATRQVAQAGTYDLTWTATPSQGAQLWIAAIQAD